MATKDEKEKRGAPSVKRTGTSSHRSESGTSRRSSTQKSAQKSTRSASESTGTKKRESAPKSEKTSSAKSTSASSKSSEKESKITTSAKSGTSSAARSKKKKKSSTKTVLLRSAAVVLVVLIVVIIGTTSVDWSFTAIKQRINDIGPMTGSGSEYPLPISGSLSSRIDKIAGGYAVLTDTTLSIYNKAGKTAFSQAHFMANPAMHTNGHYAVVYDVDGKKYRLESPSGTIAEGSTELQICAANVSRCGRFTVITRGESYESLVFVKTRLGEDIFGWQSLDCYITAGALSDSGKRLIVTGISTADGILRSSIMVFDVDNNKLLAQQTFDNVLLYDVGFTTADYAFAVGDNAVILCTDDGDEITTLRNSSVSAYNIDSESGAVFCFSEVEGADEGTIIAYDTKGRERFTQTLTKAPISVCTSRNYICVLEQGALQSIGKDGTLLEKQSVTADAKGVAVLGSECIVMCNTVIAKVQL